MTTDHWTTSKVDDLARWIGVQRWYGDKSRQAVRVTPDLIGALEFDGVDLDLIQVRFEFAADSASTYFVPLVGNDHGQFVDALTDHRILAWLGSGFDETRVLETGFGGGSRLVWKLANHALGAAWWRQSARVLGGEQSNTSVMFGDLAIAKVFRKLQPGVNPDSEIVSYLTAHGQFRHAPTCIGAIALEFDDGRESVELAAVQAFVPNQGDGWRWLPAALGEATGAGLDALLDSIRLLGQRTGELHLALADGEADDAFRPIPIEQDDVNALEARLGREVRHTASMLHQLGACSHGESEALATSLLGDIERCGALLGSFRTRVHGDYHLGQVLRVNDDFVIIDFEGEPSRTMAERRAANSPLKDVAGMLRSIDYAVASASQDATADRRRIQTQWRNDAERSFLAGYLRAGVTAPRQLVPADADVFQQALDVFMIEKALYEVRYELDNRPDWLEIPLGALKRIAGMT